MNKKILIGSMLVLTLLLLMPSIPAIECNVVNDEILSEISEDLDIKDIREILESDKFDKIRHPLLFSFVKLWLTFRWKRSVFLGNLSSHYAGFFFYVDYVILFLRAVWLNLSVDFLIYFWNNLSNSQNWNWDDLRDIIIG